MWGSYRDGIHCLRLDSFQENEKGRNFCASITHNLLSTSTLLHYPIKIKTEKGLRKNSSLELPIMFFS